jgi:hypothetical protein
MEIRIIHEPDNSAYLCVLNSDTDQVLATATFRSDGTLQLRSQQIHDPEIRLSIMTAIKYLAQVLI